MSQLYSQEPGSIYFLFEVKPLTLEMKTQLAHIQFITRPHQNIVSVHGGNDTVPNEQRGMLRPTILMLVKDSSKLEAYQHYGLQYPRSMCVQQHQLRYMCISV